MKKNFKFVLLAAAALAFAACGQENTEPDTPNEEPEEEVLNQSLAFTLEVTEVSHDQAKVKVSHNGETKDTWYGFVTDNVKGNIATLVETEVASLIKDGKVSGLKKQRSTTVTLRGLEPETDYIYIVFGLSEKGEVYGTPLSTEFKTAKGEVEYTINPAWTVSYNGAAEINGNMYEHTISVASSDKNKYFITGYSKAEFEALDIKTIAEGEVAYLKQWLDQYNQANNSNIKIDQMLFQGNGIDALNLQAGEWYALAIGVGEDGEPSGLYAVSELITIKEEEPTEEYASWLGNWTWTGSNGVAWEITFEKGISNVSYLMSGWEGPEAEGLYVEVSWMAEDSIWAIFTQSLGTYNFGAAGEGEILFVGADAEGYFYPEIGLPISLGGVLEDGSRVVYGYSEETEEGVFGFSIMHYIARIAEDWYGITNVQEWPTFPITVTPATSATRSSSENIHIQKFTQAPKTYVPVSAAFRTFSQR